MNNNLRKKNKSISKKKINRNINSDNNNINSKCIGPCYKKNTLFYHPLTLEAIIDTEQNMCPINPIFNDILNETVYCGKCNIDESIDYTKYDIFTDIIQFASTDENFLKEFYNISTINDIEIFLENNINELPFYTQKRILNSIYQIYKDDDTFPNNNYINLVKNILNKIYNIEIKSKKIIDKIMKNKYKNNWNNIFTYFSNKYK